MWAGVTTNLANVLVWACRSLYAKRIICLDVLFHVVFPPTTLVMVVTIVTNSECWPSESHDTPNLILTTLTTTIVYLGKSANSLLEFQQAGDL